MCAGCSHSGGTPGAAQNLPQPKSATRRYNAAKWQSVCVDRRAALELRKEICRQHVGRKEA